jgi:hypothetical protein
MKSVSASSAGRNLRGAKNTWVRDAIRDMKGELPRAPSKPAVHKLLMALDSELSLRIAVATMFRCPVHCANVCLKHHPWQSCGNATCDQAERALRSCSGSPQRLVFSCAITLCKLLASVQEACPVNNYIAQLGTLLLAASAVHREQHN